MGNYWDARNTVSQTKCKVWFSHLDVCFVFSFSEKLLSLLPEYVVPYTIHLLAHDPDYVKVQDIEQLKDVKE